MGRRGKVRASDEQEEPVARTVRASEETSDELRIRYIQELRRSGATQPYGRTRGSKRQTRRIIIARELKDS